MARRRFPRWVRLAVVAQLVVPATAVALQAEDPVAVPGDSIAPQPPRPRPWVVLPNLFYTPETGLAGGLVVGYYGAGGLGPRPSSVLADVTVTGHKQFILEAQPELYLEGSRLRINGEFRAKEYPDVFYGIGNRTTAEMEEDFASRIVELMVQVQREVADRAWFGVRGVLRYDDVLEVDPAGLLAGPDIPGGAGGLAVGLGLVAVRDSRDSRFAPRTGAYAELRATWFAPALASDYRFQLFEADVRRYLPLGSAGVVAGRAYAHVAGGTAPFQLLPQLGGTRLMRGYREGRFRDDVLLVVEAEYRFRLRGRFSGVVFGSLGDVAHQVDEIQPLRELERAAGAGLRFRMTEGGVNIRLDWARGRDGSGVYLSVGEAF